jgi:hypothetical protein
MPPIRFRAALTALAAAVVLAACATTASTSLDASWKAPGATAKTFRKVAIITVSDDEFVQQDVQKALAAQLKARGVNAVASGYYFTRYTEKERERFQRSVRATDADAILLARVIQTDSKMVTTAGMLVGMNGVPYASVVGVGNVAAATFAPGNYVPPSDYDKVTIHAEASLFETKGEKLMWTARAKIQNAEQGDYRKTVDQFVKVVVNAGISEGMF